MTIKPPVVGQARAIRTDWQQHWRIGLAATFGMALGTSILPSVFSLFILPLQHAFGWSRGAIGVANSASLVSGLIAPFAGRMIDRTGVRRPVLVGTALLGMCWAGLAAMSGSLVLFYFLFMALVVSGLLTTGLTYSHLICASFTRSRGFSLAVSRSGVAISAALLPTFLEWMMRIGGWRAAYLALSALVLLVALPIVTIGTRAASTLPQEKKLGAAHVPSFALPEVSDRRAFTIALAAALAYLPLLAIMTQSQPLLIDRGLSRETASHVIGLFGVASFAGAFGTGLLLDRFWAPAVAAVLLMAGALGALLLAIGPMGNPTAVIAVLLLGLTLGAEIDLVAFLVARYCGVRRYGRVFGFSVLAISLASALGSSGIGFLYDATGSYRLALMLSALSFGLSACAYLSLGRYPHPAPE